MKSQKIDKRLLVNLAKGTTAWAAITGLCTLPAVLFCDKAHIADNALLVFIMAGFFAPWIYTVNGGRNIGQQYVDAFDCVATKIRQAISNKKIPRLNSSTDATVPKATAERTANTVKFIEFLNQRRK